MQHARDDIYCSLIARRAVARAALHLGIADMTAEALNVLGDVVLEYVSRIGRTISHSVEASGRSSAHVNVFDALRAIELCTTNAVTHMHIPVKGTGGGDHTSSITNNSSTNTSIHERQEIQDTSWKGLAAFLFGPDWDKEDNIRTDLYNSNSNNDGESVGVGGGGKVGPSATAHRAGWHAPYPEEIPFFPVVQNPSLIANPHSLDREKALEELHSIVIEKPDQEEEEKEKKNRDTEIKIPEQEEIPDAIFQKDTWGAVQDGTDTTKRKGSATEENVPISKKSKTKELGKEEETDQSGSESKLFLPFYYPPIPKADTNYRTIVVDALPVEKAQEVQPKSSDPHLVRSSLVQLDQQERNQYWGAIQSGPIVKAGIPEQDVVVVLGQQQVQPQIVPLGRASGSRVSRILEGSMDVGP